MEDRKGLDKIIDSAVKDISKRVAKLEMIDANIFQIDLNETCCLYTTTKGDYMLTIVLYTNNCVLKAITQNMKRSNVTNDEDIPIYTIEYFNILCGHVVTAMNKMLCVKARFDIPKIKKGAFTEEAPNSYKVEQKNEFCYSSPYGPIKLETFYQCAS